MRIWARLTWQAEHPERLAADLARRLGADASPHDWQEGSFAISLGNATLEVVPWRRESPSDDPLAGGRLVFEGVPGGLAKPALAELPPIVLAGVGWATVELDRAESELAEWLAGEAPDPADDAADPILGARARLRLADGLPGEEIVLLEPSTEGRVAASLVRDGEGPCALYVHPAGGLDAWLAAAREPGRRDEHGRARAVRAVGPRRRRPSRRPAPAGRRPALIAAPGGYHPGMNDVARITLRAAAIDDAERLATLLTDEGYPAGPSDLVARIERFSTPDAQVIVAEAGGEVVGFVAFHVVPRFETDERFIRIIAVVVDALERERGVAHRLLADVERVARDEGVSFVEVTAGHHRPEARQLFESLGYDAGVTAYLRKRP